MEYGTYIQDQQTVTGTTDHKNIAHQVFIAIAGHHCHQ